MKKPIMKIQFVAALTFSFLISSQSFGAEKGAGQLAWEGIMALSCVKLAIMTLDNGDGDLTFKTKLRKRKNTHIQKGYRDLAKSYALAKEGKVDEKEWRKNAPMLFRVFNVYANTFKAAITSPSFDETSFFVAETFSYLSDDIVRNVKPSLARSEYQKDGCWDKHS